MISLYLSLQLLPTLNDHVHDLFIFIYLFYTAKNVIVSKIKDTETLIKDTDKVLNYDIHCYHLFLYKCRILKTKKMG